MTWSRRLNSAVPEKISEAPAPKVAKSEERPPESDPYVEKNLPLFLSEKLRQAAELEAIARGHGSLKHGDRGAAVKELQSALVDLGIDVPGGVDGIYGKGTAEAVKKVQSEGGLEATGVADAEALIAIDQRLRSKAQA